MARVRGRRKGALKPGLAPRAAGWAAMTDQVHYELHLRRRAGDDWALDHAGPQRATVLEAAAAALADGRAAAVRVVKEVFHEAEGAFSSVTILEQGHARKARALSGARRAAAPPCSSPSDLLSRHARERIAELFEAVLRRERVTAWELLHRPDLAEALEASGQEVQGAVQRAAVPEAQAQGVATHGMVRAFSRLADATLERLIADGRRGLLPEVGPDSLADAAERLSGEPDAAWRLGGGVAAHLRGAGGWRGKAERLVALLEAAPSDGRARALALRVLEPPLAEMLGGAAPLADLVGGELDLGGQLAVLVRLAAGREANLLAAADAEIARAIPPLAGPAARLSELLDGPAFDSVRASLAARILRELTGPRRLRPADPDGEITILRALAAVLTAAVGRLLPREAVAAAFVERSKRLVAADFVGDYLRERGGPTAEVRALLRLCGNLTGPINQRAGARWLLSVLDSLRFEKEVRLGPDPPGVRLAVLAGLQRSVATATLPDAEAEAARARLGEAGGWIEETSNVSATLAGAGGSALTRLAALMRLATGEGAPHGPATRRAAEAARRLALSPSIRAELGVRPDAAPLVRAAAAAGREPAAA